MKKKLILLLTLLLLLFISAFGLVACNDIEDSRNPDIVDVYNQYVAYAESNGDTPLSYEDWLESIKGEKGDKGDKGEQGETGTPGENGNDGVTPKLKINTEGYWEVSYDNGVTWEALGIKAIGEQGPQGEQGETGTPGENGNDGVTPKLKINTEGYWEVSYDNGATWESLGIKAIGEQGIKGETIKSIEFDDQGRIVITLTDDTKLDPIEIPNKEEHEHSYGDWLDWTTDETISCENRMFYRICSSCKKVEWKIGNEHDWESITIDPTCQKQGYDDRTCKTCGKNEKINYTPISDHNWQKEYSFDNSYHYIKCCDCIETKDKAEHTPNEENYCSICDKPLGPTEGILYDLSSDGNYAAVIGYEGTAKRIIIASEYQGKPVKTIYDSVFYETSITSVIIPDSVISIGEDAFYNCDSLTKVNYKGTIDEWAQIEFEYYYSNPLYYAKNLYINNVLIREVKLTTSTKISNYAFSHCDSLESIVIPDSVTSIGEDAFSHCDSLTSVEIGDNVTSIGDYAFNSCDSLESIVIPDSVTSIGIQAISFCNSLESVVIGDSVTSIGDYAFYGCSSLTSIEIPDSVTNIGDDAFEGCGKLFNDVGALRYIKAKNNDYHILYSVLNQNYSSYTINENTRIIDGRAFYNCERLSSIIIPDSVISIGEGAFYNCTSLTSIEIPDSVTWIGNEAFYGCRSLTSITIGNGVTSIGYAAFVGCNSLTSVTFNDTSTWYRTFDSTEWDNKTGGTEMDVTNSSTNATYINAYGYWYKK